MSGSFPVRLMELRKERNLTQKEAASNLGVSQALLSHYEKGIRECSLDFVCRAAAYYDVTCDYLLGMTESKKSLGAEFENHDLPHDKEMRISTVYRAGSMLQELLGDGNAKSGEKVKSFLSVGVYRLAVNAAAGGNIPKEWIRFPLDFASVSSDAIMDSLLLQIADIKPQKAGKIGKEPQCIKTVISEVEKTLIRIMSEVIEEKE